MCRLYFNYLLLFGLLLFFSSCSKKTTIVDTRQKFLHLSHTRTDTNPSLINGVDKIDFSKYDMLLLGGDLTESTSIDTATIDYVDGIFDLSRPTTLFALGNHDYTNTNLISAYTQRPPYFAYRHGAVQFVVLDTQDSYSSIVWEQQDFLNAVLDTLTTASHLFILHHKLIWMYDHIDLNDQIESISNGIFGSCFYCLNENNFHEDIYPKLAQIQSQGISVVCVAGDIGKRVNEFEYMTDEGIHFLASGMDYQSDRNKALLFFYDRETQALSWEYRWLSEL